jgi:cytochrome c-type biogenesis protein CcmH
MKTFVLLAALFASAGLLVILGPLLKRRSRRDLVVAGVLALVVPLGALGLYRHMSGYPFDAPAAAVAGPPHSIEEMIEKLESRLKAHPDDVDGWLMLGRSESVQKNVPKAVEAFRQAYTVSKGENVEAMVSYAEALFSMDQATIRGEAGELVEKVLARDPLNPKGLWYGGVRAAVANDLELARSRWLKLLPLDLPPDVKSMVAQQIRDADTALGRTKDVELDRLVAANKDSSPAPSEAAPPAPAQASGTGLRVHVDIAPQVRGKVPAGALLFVLARDPSQPGPPFAVKRFAAAALPMDVELSEQDAMMPGRTLKDAHHLVVVARYSRSGMPQQQSGDLYGEVEVPAGGRGPLNLRIDREVP